MIHDTHTVTDSINFISAMRDKESWSRKILQHIQQFLFQIPPKITVKGRKRLIQHQNIRTGQKNTRQCDSLLLSA